MAPMAVTSRPIAKTIESRFAPWRLSPVRIIARTSCASIISSASPRWSAVRMADNHQIDASRAHDPIYSVQAQSAEPVTGIVDHVSVVRSRWAQS